MDGPCNKIKSQYSNRAWQQMVSAYYYSLSPERRSQQINNIDAYFVANHWDFAKVLAQDGTNGTTNVGDKYLATITTSLENSLVSQGKRIHCLSVAREAEILHGQPMLLIRMAIIGLLVQKAPGQVVIAQREEQFKAPNLRIILVSS